MSDSPHKKNLPDEEARSLNDVFDYFIGEEARALVEDIKLEMKTPNTRLIVIKKPDKFLLSFCISRPRWSVVMSRIVMYCGAFVAFEKLYTLF